MKYLYDDGQFKLVIDKGDILGSKNYNETQIIYVIEGNAALDLDGVAIHINSEDFLIINNRSYCSTLASENLLLCNIVVSNMVLKRYSNGNIIQFRCSPLLDDTGFAGVLRQKLKQLTNLVITLKESSNDIRMTSLFFQMLEILICYYSVDASKVSDLEKHTHWKEQIEEFVEKNYSRHIDLKELSRELYLTYYYLSRNFYHMFGMSYNNYVNTIRLKHVLWDLQFTSKNMTRIAIDNGFASASILNRVFKKVYSSKPLEYRKLKAAEAKNNESVQMNIFLHDQQVDEIHNEHITDPAVEHKMSKITVDVLQYKDYHNAFNSMINIGFAPDLLYSGLQQHMIVLQQELGFSYMRLWNIFHSSMDLWNGKDLFHVNYSKIDQIFDFLVDHHMKPFIEFGDKFKHIINAVSITTLNKARDSAVHTFRSLELFRGMIESFIEHIIERYGMEETSAWRYELCNEALINGYSWGNDDDSFFMLFDIVYDTIKARLPSAIVGGSCMPVEYDLKSFYLQWKKHRLPDFVSVMHYLNRIGDVNREYETDVDCFECSLDTIRKLLEELNMKCMVYVTEWNSTVCRHYQNDSCYQAAYCIKNAIDSYEKADLVGYWLGSDRFISDAELDLPFNGSPGLLSRDGIRKPVFFAFKFLYEADKFLIYSDKHSSITTDARGSYTIVCHNFQSMDYRYYTLPQNQWDISQHIDYQDNGEKFMLEFRLKNVKCGNYRITVSEMSPSKGNALREWMDIGAKKKLTKYETEYLKSICIPRLSSQLVEVRDERILALKMDMEPQEIAFIKITLDKENCCG